MSRGGVEVAFSTGDNDGHVGGQSRILLGEGMKGSLDGTTDQVLGSHT